MRNLSALSRAESQAFFHTEGQHVPLQLCRLPDARMVWVNQRVMRQDPAFIACGGTLATYSDYLLQACAYVIATEDTGDSLAIGVADRYGGRGIGHNGGSGRAVVVNGYHVKGVGRTPLIGTITDEAHASGGAYLEECVRETIFAELAAAEFPGGTIPTLAIIDTGLVQVWQEDHGPRPERRCLLIRPSFVRPAHFERAPSYISIDPRDGYVDSQRVRHAFQTATELWGHDSLPAIYEKFWLTWSEQLAYAFAHRLPHGGDSTSNIALDGQLLDFGAMTAIPSWARISLKWSGPPAGESLYYLVQAVRSHAIFLGRYVDATLATPEAIGCALNAVVQRYQAALLREMLRLAGLTRPQAESLLQAEPAVSRLLGRLMTHYRREQFTLFEGTPSPRIPWDIERLWSSEPPTHWLLLRDFLMEKRDLLSECGRVDHELWAERVKLRSRSRPALYRARIKRELYLTLELHMAGVALNQNSLDRLIAETVCQNRRDSHIEPNDAIPIGFARGATASYALFRSLDTDACFAMQEWQSELGEPLNPGEKMRKFSVSELVEDKVVFDDASLALIPLEI